MGNFDLEYNFKDIKLQIQDDIVDIEVLKCKLK